jgi:two-component system, cell cycle sensor histidine kinase and response regulator CckA
VGLVEADPMQLEQVLMNLVLNARDAMPDGGTITIVTADADLDLRFAHGHIDLPAGSYVLIAVHDTGVGIPPELQPHLFEPFFTTKPVGQGTGLGLATSYGIVKQHGGTIWLYSEVGHGTVVKVYLPRTAGDVAPAPAEVVSDALPCGSETILLAEDEAAVRALTARVLRECGYTVLEASDGAEAVRLAAAHASTPIHLFLSDVVMPNLGGPTAAAAIRTSHPDIAVLFMSGYLGVGQDQGHAPQIEAALLQKPFTSLGLTRAIRAALESWS